MSRAAFQRRHYQAVADIVARAKARPNDCAQEAITDLQQDFADFFAGGNGRFDRERFARACEARKPVAASPPAGTNPGLRCR